MSDWVFESSLQTCFHTASNKLAHLFNSLSGYFARILTHLRVGLSRGRLFSFNLRDNPICPLCNNEFESTHHFLFSCSSLTVYCRTFPFWEHDLKKNFWVVLELRKKLPKSSDEWRKDLQENQYTSFIIILDNFTQFSKQGENWFFNFFFILKR